MLKVFIYLFFFLLPVSYSSEKNVLLPAPAVSDCQQLYDEMHLENTINYTAFEQAFEGYKKIDEKNKDIITLIDFTKPSSEERFFVLDITQKKILFSSYVSHGKNSGDNYATSFSNKNGSHKSSLGFYLTGETYKGRNGYSLILNGLEKGINDKARERSIVIHAADYSNPSVIASSGRLGRSHGCPALPEDICGPIINAIKDGSLLYIYAGNQNYQAQSSILSVTKNKKTTT